MCDVDECCTRFRPFPPSSVAETYCRCGEQIHRYPRGHPNSLCKIRDELFAPSCGQLNGLFGYRSDRSSEENVHAVIAPGTRPTPPSAADINEFHCSHGHMYEDLLRKTAKQMEVKLQGQLVPC